MLIKEIEPIGAATTNLLIKTSDDLIDRIIELPLRKACKTFRDKGIETLMSSANKNNVLEDGVKPTEKEDVYDGTLKKIMESHNFMEVGNGYAWIMLNYNSLSDENKRILFELEQSKDNDGNNIGENLFWFAHPFMMTSNIQYSLRTGKFSKEYVKQILGNEPLPENIEYDASLHDFDKRQIILYYPWEFTTEAVFLRMPINKQTTVEDVEVYFDKLTILFKSQNLKIKSDSKLK